MLTKLCSADATVARIVELGKGSMLAKIDVKQAYHNIPVHPEDRTLLGMQFEKQIYVEAMLPFQSQNIHSDGGYSKMDHPQTWSRMGHPLLTWVTILPWYLDPRSALET